MPSSTYQDGCRLYVGNLAYHGTEQDMRALFADYDMCSVTIPRTNRAVGYGFVDLTTPLQAQTAIVSRTHGRRVAYGARWKTDGGVWLYTGRGTSRNETRHGSSITLETTWQFGAGEHIGRLLTGHIGTGNQSGCSGTFMSCIFG